jgi:hypothetical protein
MINETNIEKLFEADEIRAKVIFNLPMTEQEKVKFLLFYSTMEEATEFLKREKRGQKNVNSK